MKYDMIMFDIDGTIWDVSNIITKAVNEVLKNHDIIRSVTHDQIIGGLGLSHVDFSNHVLSFVGEVDDRMQMVKEADAIKNKMIDEQGVTPYPYFREVIKELSNHYKIAIVSNCGPNTIEQLLDVLDINSYVTDFMAASRFKITKGEAIKRVAENNNATNFVYIGDTITDKRACEEAGSDFIFATYGFGKDVESKYHIDSLNELCDVIKKMEEDNE